MTDSPMMQDIDRQTVEHLKLVISALERDKRLLQNQLATQNGLIEDIKTIVAADGKVQYCDACGRFYEQFTRCDCIEGVDY